MYVMDYNIDNNLYSMRDKIQEIFIDHLLSNNVTLTLHKRVLINRAVSCFVLNMPCHKLSMGITLKKDHYSNYPINNGQKIDRKVSYKYTKDLLTCLELLGYITIYKGTSSWKYFNDEWIMSENSSGYIVIKQPLITIRDTYRTGLMRTNIKNVLILRDKSKKEITFKSNEFTKSKRVLLNSYNTLAIDHSVTCGDKICDVQSYKVYNTDFTKGGRSFMSGEDNIQSLTKEERKLITIDGKDTCCYDYRGFEPTIIYSMKKESLIDDPYEIVMEDYDEKVLRKLCKGILLRMLNTSDPDECYKICLFYVAEDFNVSDLYQRGLIPQKRIPIKGIIQRLEKKHAAILDCMYCNYGVTVQNIGSAINDYIVEYFVQRHVLPLQIHDSFIIDKDYDQELYDVMHQGFDIVLGFSDNVRLVKEF